MASADLTYSIEVSKYASRDLLGVIRNKPDGDDFSYLLNKQMILQVLGDPVCLEELTDEEQAELEGLLILKS